MATDDDLQRLLSIQSSLLQRRSRVLAEIDGELATLAKIITDVRNGARVTWNGDWVSIDYSQIELPSTGEFQKSLMAEIVRNGTLHYGVLAQEYFGTNDAASRQKIRNALNHLRKRGFIARQGRNSWVVCQRKPRGRPPKAKSR